MNDSCSKIYLIFETTRDTILSERECKASGFNCMAVPVPREYSSKCGIALEIPCGNEIEIKELIGSTGRRFKSFGGGAVQTEGSEKVCGCRK